MQSIYEPSGKAREYCERAVNLYRGCDHGCTYCYAPSALRMKRANFSRVTPRPGIVDSIRKEAPKHAGKEVLLCFTTDPYCVASTDVTRESIIALQDGGCRVTILTKGGTRSGRDFDILRPGVDRYGTTITDLHDSSAYEPNAAPPSERIFTLKMAHFIGFETWVSLEPVIDPSQSLAIIKATHEFVDMYKIGKWNYGQESKMIDWRKFALNAVELSNKLGVKYMLKKDLAAYLV